MQGNFMVVPGFYKCEVDETTLGLEVASGKRSQFVLALSLACANVSCATV